MAQEQAQSSNMIDIEQVSVQFTRLEESQYKEEEDAMKAMVMELIKTKRDDDLVESEIYQKIQSASQKLKAILISCGEHADESKVKNVYSKVIKDPKNVIFQLFHNKKREINVHLYRTLLNLLQTAELHWMKDDMAVAAGFYDIMADIFVNVDELNDRFVEVLEKGDKIQSDEEMELDEGEDCESSSESLKEEANDLKSEQVDEIHRKRRAGEQKHLPQKVRRLEDKEEEEEEEIDEAMLVSEEKAEKEMAELKKRATEPIIIDCILLIRGLLCTEELETNKEVEMKMKEVRNKLGGDEEISKKLDDISERYTEAERKTVADNEIEKKVIFEEWAGNKDQYYGLLRVFRAITRSYESKSAISERNNWDGVMPLLDHMAFWPIFKISNQHLVDAQIDRTRISEQSHNDEVCMGKCNGKTAEEMSKSYETCSNQEVLQKMSKFIEHLEKMRKELSADYTKLMVFTKKLKPWASLLFRSSTQDTLFCEHKLFENSTISIDETSRRRESKKLKCLVCSVLHTLAHLKFAIGTGSFHGKEKIGSEKTIDQFFSMLLQIEKSKNSEIDGLKELNEFESYMDRLRRTTLHIKSSCAAIVAYNKCLYKISYHTQRINMSFLKRIHEDKQDWADDRLRDFALQSNEEKYHLNKKRLNTTCAELRYLMNLYENSSTEWYEKETCLICYSKLEVFVNFPCGHIICERCYRESQRRNGDHDGLECVMRCDSFYYENIVLARGKAISSEKGYDSDRKEDVIPGITLAVKLNAVINLIKNIIDEDSKNKILVLTTFEFASPIWSYLSKILRKAKIPFVDCNCDNASSSGTSAQSKILLCPFSKCANGLIESQASHIIVLDPPHSFSDIEQAIADYRKDHPNRAIKTHHIIVENSIEEELWKIANKRNELTVGDIRQIFGIAPRNQS